MLVVNWQVIKYYLKLQICWNQIHLTWTFLIPRLVLISIYVTRSHQVYVCSTHHSLYQISDLGQVFPIGEIGWKNWVIKVLVTIPLLYVTHHMLHVTCNMLISLQFSSSARTAWVWWRWAWRYYEGTVTRHKCDPPPRARPVTSHFSHEPSHN